MIKSRCQITMHDQRRSRRRLYGMYYG